MKALKLYIFPLLLITGLMCSSSTFAQANVWFGGGVNFSKMRKVYANEAFSTEDTPRTGFNLGLSFAQSINENMGIETSVIYDTKGYVTKMDDALNTTLRFKTHYLDIYPVSLQYYVPYSDKSRFYGELGPYLGVGLFGKQSQRDDNGYNEEDIDWGALELERFDFGLNLGVGYELNKALQCELSYDLGLKNITDNTNEYTKIRNNTIKLSIKVSLSHMFAPIMREDRRGFKKKGSVIPEEGNSE